jgi:hypothetical protein
VTPKSRSVQCTPRRPATPILAESHLRPPPPQIHPPYRRLYLCSLLILPSAHHPAPDPIDIRLTLRAGRTIRKGMTRFSAAWNDGRVGKDLFAVRGDGRDGFRARVGARLDGDWSGRETDHIDIVEWIETDVDLCCFDVSNEVETIVRVRQGKLQETKMRDVFRDCFRFISHSTNKDKDKDMSVYTRYLRWVVCIKAFSAGPSYLGYAGHLLLGPIVKYSMRKHHSEYLFISNLAPTLVPLFTHPSASFISISLRCPRSLQSPHQSRLETAHPDIESTDYRIRHSNRSSCTVVVIGNEDASIHAPCEAGVAR